ncbi:MAG: type IV toxin-antitoxin system AbiEi family antitoxin domain-containing protein [Acidimicrobiales bacterium]|nr:type IV toxin-antitoxin system AbiEi family antitoxin domain-containing protein [Acidimicrobiales bacterium]
MQKLDRRLAPTFASQLALITRRQVLAAGGSSSAVDRRVASGRWEVAERAVYALTGVPWTWRRNLAAVVLSVSRAAASHRAAASLLGAHWDDRASPPIELCVPDRSSPARSFHRTRDRSPGIPIVVHENLDLGRVPHRLVDGIPTTAPLRLAVDLGSVVPFEQYRRAMAQLRRDHGIDWPDLERVYRQHSAQGRNGCGSLRELLDRHFSTEGAPDEVIEGRCADLLVAAGLPEPVHQHEVRRPDGTIARFDLAYPELRIAIETDGSIHGEEEVRQRDNRRRNDAQLLGWRVFHFTWEDVVFHPERVVATVRAARASTAA